MNVCRDIYTPFAIRQINCIPIGFYTDVKFASRLGSTIEAFFIESIR
jgi:hypothetical protein